jgi:hypothetical protein
MHAALSGVKSAPEFADEERNFSMKIRTLGFTGGKNGRARLPAARRRGSSGRAAALLALACGVAGVPRLQAQAREVSDVDLREEVRHLRGELAAMREEINELKKGFSSSAATEGRRAALRNAALRIGNGSAGDSAADQENRQEVSAAAKLEMLQAQIAEHAQTKVESNSRWPVRIFGTILSHTFWNSSSANWLDLPNMAMPDGSASLRGGSFSSTLRQSSFGAILEGPAIGSMKSSAFVTMDFYGGIPSFETGQVMGLPRLLYAYARLEGERTAFEAGQDQMILAPKNPTTLASQSFPDLYNSGNLYLRAPQLRVEQMWVARPENEVQVIAGILAPVTGDNTAAVYTFVPPNLAGEHSQQPAFQARLGWRHGPREAGGFELGFSGHTSNARFATKSTRSWAAAVDFDAHAGRFGLGVEAFAGRNLAAFGGSLGQLARSAGGFIEGRIKATDRLSLNGGFGTDQLFDLKTLPAPLTSNSSVFANFIYALTPELQTSFEYRWLSTTDAVNVSRHNNHLDLVFAYRF